MLAVGSPVLPPLIPLGLVSLGLLATTYVFWESLTRFHAQVEEVLTTLGSTPAVPDAARPARERAEQRELTRLLSERYGLAVQTTDFIVPLHPTALNQPIRALGLRQLTGASLIAIYRDPEQIIIPQAETVLLPGDVLVLLGEQDQLEAAIRFMTELASQKVSATATPPQVAPLVVPEGSPFVGRTLAELGLREELGVLVVGARRGAEQITNPGPDFQVQAGDLLYLWGPPSHIEKVRHRA